MNPMEGIVFTNLIILLALIPVGLVLAWSILRGLDALLGVSFKDDVYPIIVRNPMSATIYFSVRFAFVLYFVSQLLSRFV